ncbi:MAG: 23S rRNA (guanosine(2251)-2'-O)-methyltransferase RlmB, partial [Mycobacteriales bacterium]
MAGNSRRGGAQRTPGSKKGAVAGTGGKNRKQLTGRGPTPPARARPGHPAQRQADSAERVRAVDAGSRGAGPGTGG